MKFLSRVVWSEGMYLGPHHFQTQSRYFEDSISFVMASLWREPWGLLHCALDEDAIANGNCVLLHASGIFPDGLAFDLPESDPGPAARNLKELFPLAENSLAVYLAVPARRDQGADFNRDPAASVRFGPMLRSMRDESNGTDEREVELGRKNLRLVTAGEITPDMVALPLAQVLRDGRGHLLYDPEFVPACLRIGASDVLMLRLKRLLEALADRSVAAGKERRRGGRFEAGVSPLDVSNYWFLHALSSAIPPLRHLLATRRAHPEELFIELSRLAGALCTFTLDSDPAQLPEYSHSSLGDSIAALDAQIRRHLEIFVPSNTLALEFATAAPYIFEAGVPDERCLRRARWILGMRSSLGESELVRVVPQLVKLCSARFVPELVKRALPGLTLTHMPAPPSALRPEPDMHYFAADLAGPCWEHIQQTRRAGLYIPGEIAEPEFSLTVIMEQTP